MRRAVGTIAIAIVLASGTPAGASHLPLPDACYRMRAIRQAGDLRGDFAKYAREVIRNCLDQWRELKD